MMKWDVKHDRAKRIIDAFLEDAGCWRKKADLSADLTDEDKELVNAEVALMITSIRKRYKLQERLTEQVAQICLEENEAVFPTEKAEETLPEPISEDKETEKPKRIRRASTGEKKAPSRKKKKESQEEKGKGELVV